MMEANQSVPNGHFVFRNALTRISVESLNRVQRIVSPPFIRTLVWSSAATAVQAVGLIRRDTDNATNTHSSDSNSTSTGVAFDVSFLANLFDFYDWKNRVDTIRRDHNQRQCLTALANLLATIGPLQSTEISGTAGALSLLPTAGALIGAPAKELWLVYKLVPLGGFLSMLLSLGGNIVPSQASDYRISSDGMNYGGLIGKSRTRNSELDDEDLLQFSPGVDEVWKFAARVKYRAQMKTGAVENHRIIFAMALQVFWIAIIAGACWFTQIGSIVVWWCTGWYWMIFWYLAVAASSVLENIAGVPFTRQWTIRVSKAPTDIQVSPDAPVVAQSRYREAAPSVMEDKPHDNFEEIRPETPFSPTLRPTLSTRPTETLTDNSMALLTSSRTNTRILEDLAIGFNTTSRVVLDKQAPYSRSQKVFYVIISLEEVSRAHAAFRVISKAISVGVFGFGTAIFASTTLLTISVALTVLCLVLAAGVFGRVVAMWMASELMKHRPVLHKTVRKDTEAADYINEVLAIQGIVCEVSGHVIINGRCVRRYNKWWTWAHYVGIMAGPYDVAKLAR